MNDADIYQTVRSVLIEARKLQIARIKAAFAAGWRLPFGICEKYHKLYLLRVRAMDYAAANYLELYGEFASDIESAGGFPDSLSAIDPFTIFGEICSGERTESGEVSTAGVGVTHH